MLDLLRTAGAEGISRLELAERTGLTPQAVSKITARLRADGLAADAGRRASTGGKPRTVLRLVPEAGHAVGVHLDRDELRAVLVDLDGTVVGERNTPLDLGAGADAVLTRVAGVVEELWENGTRYRERRRRSRWHRRRQENRENRENQEGRKRGGTRQPYADAAVSPCSAPGSRCPDHWTTPGACCTG
ncbi:hypothetical protein SHIRM173S_11669 [Streptomyces hirsutus]